ncbi:hypothetical protein H5410_015558 [Solanum commersonii]|uniref:Uncharacterized protein n=1 Tax=Solanum commersonii TaxID=4109 RepID=A0A9J5ZU17_SOLCO|nr:hypothetical protein H5410_015558 [Solanum commersonii]
MGGISLLEDYYMIGNWKESWSCSRPWNLSKASKNLRIRCAGNLEVMDYLHTTTILDKMHNLTGDHGGSSGRLRPLTKSYVFLGL